MSHDESTVPLSVVESAVKGHRQELILKVSNSTDVQKLATSIRKNIENENGTRLIISAIGVQAINQAVKSVAIANERTSQQGFLLFLYPYFHTEKKRDDVIDTIMRFVVTKHLIGT